MKTSLAGPNAMSRIRVFLIATCIIAVTPRLSADIILLSRLSDAEACAYVIRIIIRHRNHKLDSCQPICRNLAYGCIAGIALLLPRQLRRAIPRSS